MPAISLDERREIPVLAGHHIAGLGALGLRGSEPAVAQDLRRCGKPDVLRSVVETVEHGGKRPLLTAVYLAMTVP
jgi:hypothetical protein